jgi:proteasome lid subunit RPN8/RPN11
VITRLVLTPAVRDELFAHARSGAATEEHHDRSGSASGDRSGSGPDRPALDSNDQPASEEVCGVLGGDQRDAGDPAGETGFVTTCRHVPNVAAEPTTRYELDPAATVAAIEALEAEGRDHIGFYHSHPRGPRGPSATDQSQATWPGYVYLIVSLGADPSDADPVIGAWRWSGDSFVQLPISVAPLNGD